MPAGDPARADRRSVNRLARLSFTDGETAAGILAGEPFGWWDPLGAEPADDTAAVAVAALGRTADPDAALAALARIAAVDPDVLHAVRGDGEVRGRLLPLLAASPALAEHLAARPQDWTALRGRLDVDGFASRLAAAVGADPTDPVTGGGGTPARIVGDEAVTALRFAYRRELLAVAGRDLAGTLDLRVTSEVLADLAAALVQAALAVAAAQLGAAARRGRCRLAVVGMGKTGGRELNYLSDVDVIFVAEPAEDGADVDAALAGAARLAAEMMRVCRAVAWEVDAALRPEGRSGPLVRTLASHVAYYERWAGTWEFQALLKARPIAGDQVLGRRYVEELAPLVWRAAERPDFVDDVRGMRRRVLAHVPSRVADREIKLGSGGLRDVEFAVQLLQLVHGRGDDSLRVGGTLPALDALRDGGYVGRDDAVSLQDAYVFLRTTEHRLQLRRLRRTHLVPDDPADRLWLARAMGYRGDHRGDARAVWETEWALHAREVRRLHEKLFYRPLLEAVARVPSEALRLTPEEAGRRLAALGFAQPQAALRHLQALTAGLSRRAALQRALLPALLSYFADAPDPDGGLLAYRQISDALGASPWYLRLLRDEGVVATRLAFLLGTSRYVVRMLARAPEALQLLADDQQLRARPAAEVLAAMRDAAARQGDAAAAVAVIRGIRRQELLRIAFADLLGLLDLPGVCAALSAVTDATLDAALGVAVRDAAGERAVSLRFTLIAMGRLGGCEVGYGSDADVLFVFEPTGADDGDAGRLALEIATRLRALLAAPSATDPPLDVDADLRPEGRNGPLVRSLASYAQYYARWAQPWEKQALLRARPVAGDADLGARFAELVDPVRYPQGGLDRDEAREIRRLKGRVDSERLPRGADPRLHTKLGRGGLADIEWTVQLVQLQHAAAVAALRTPRTLEALGAAVDARLLTAAQADALQTAWRSATRVRNALMLVRDRAEDQLPAGGAGVVAVGRALGLPAGFDPGRLVDDYLRDARHARRVVEEVFYAPAPR